MAARQIVNECAGGVGVSGIRGSLFFKRQSDRHAILGILLYNNRLAKRDADKTKIKDNPRLLYAKYCFFFTNDLLLSLLCALATSHEFSPLVVYFMGGVASPE